MFAHIKTNKVSEIHKVMTFWYTILVIYLKKYKQGSFVTTVENLQKSSSGVNESKAFTSSRLNSTYEGKTVGSVDFVSYNNFSVLNDLQSDEIDAVPLDSCATASEAVIVSKVSQKNDGSGKKLNDGVKSCIVPTSPVIDDKYNLQLAFRPRHRATIALATNVKTFKAWDSQTSDKFGFIPLGDLILPQKNEKMKAANQFLKFMIRSANQKALTS